MSAELMRDIIAGFSRSDLRPLLDALQDDVVWKSASRHGGPFSFDGDHRNRAGVREVLSNIAKDYTFHRMEPKEVVVAGDVVWGCFDVALSYDAKGKGINPVPIEFEVAIRWRMKDGKIIEHQAFFDTAHLLMKQKEAQA